MKLCLVNAHTENYAEMAQLTTYYNHAAYCRKNGYDFVAFTDGFTLPSILPGAWDKVKFIRDVVSSMCYDWVIWCDTDTLFTNFNKPFDQLLDDRIHVVIGCDWCAPIQSGSFAIRNSPQGITYINTILSLYRRLKDHWWAENQAMILTLPKLRRLVKIVPQKWINAYDYALYDALYPGGDRKNSLDFYGHEAQWAKGDMLIHWPGLPLNVRIEQIEKTLPLVIK